MKKYKFRVFMGGKDETAKLTNLIRWELLFSSLQVKRMSSPNCQEVLRTVLEEHAHQLRALLRELVLKERTIATLEAENRELRAISRALETERALAANANERLDCLLYTSPSPRDS